jgi:hypothetical protein
MRDATAGIVIFSGSLYALAISGVRTLGAITPLGGLSFIVAWFVLATPSCAERADFAHRVAPEIGGIAACISGFPVRSRTDMLLRHSTPTR